ncbi:putative G3BP-like protein [Cinnamomum micranthum f. kanehirae]|uniref:Putative G3BP-like protein n=1 Tax=Cinnamomum micranthum f. kanehirae TaxID=337451 RepID=A0A3S3M432_9MAGN|nr:putative G3BP-like protein [Cinnamomum micranthum f. kanehirae]
MASQTESPAPAPAPAPAAARATAPAAQVVGNAFVDQYYHILHQSPELVYRFYQDSSMLSRPELNGVMTSVTTMQAINEKILSLDYKNFKAEIKTADAQESYKGGVIVLVTGFLTGKDNVRRKFTQSFFLAPQDKGYFVLNDVFRYSDENETPEMNPTLVDGSSENVPIENVPIENVPTTPLTPDPVSEPSQATDRPVLDPGTPSEEDIDNGEEVCDPSDNEDGSVVEDVEVEQPAVHSSQNEEQQVVEMTPSVQEDAPKKSYASILKVTKDSTTPSTVYVPTTIVKVAPKNTERLPIAPALAPEAATPTSNNASESTNLHEEVEGHSIYIGGLPLSATVTQLEEEFKKFGAIKPNGIQVRSNKAQGFCFGFIEFESSSSVHPAIAASPILIGGRQAFVEEKKTTSRGGAGGGRGRFPPGRGNFRNDSFRGRGNYGGRGYGRNDFGNRGDYSGRPRGYQRSDQNGQGRSGRSGGVGQTGVDGEAQM